MAVMSTPITKEALLKPLALSANDRLTVELDEDAKNFKLFVGSADPNGWPSDAATFRFTERFPQRKESGMRMGRSWTVPATDISVQLIASLWPESQVQWSEDARVMFQYLLVTLKHQQIAIHRTARFREYLTLKQVVTSLAIPTPQLCKQYQLKDGEHLMLHQCVALENSMHTDGYDLFMEQGTGKTPVIIARVGIECEKINREENRMMRVLIVAPKNVRQNWLVEFERFSPVHGKVTVLRGGEFKRMKQFFTALQRGEDPTLKYTVVVVSYEALTNSWEVLSKIKWDLGVLDEMHYIKGSATKRAKSAILLRDICDARQGLTGTPVCNTVFDLFTPLEFTREGGSGFTSRDAFTKFYGVYEQRDKTRNRRRLVDIQNLPFMKERLARMSFIVRKSEVLPDLPEKVYDILEAEMTPEQEEVYQKISEQLYAEIESDMSDETKMVTADNILTKLLRLAQVTSGFVSYDPVEDLSTGETLVERSVDRFDPNPKIEALVEVLKEKEPHQKTIVWAHFKQDIMTIMARLRLEGIDAVEFRGGTRENDRADAVSRFNKDPACKVFVGNPGAGGTGVNLLGYDYTSDKPGETNCDHVIYFSQDWSHPKRSQSEDRCHRMGTRANVRISDLVIIGTIDEEIRARVTNKRSSALQVQDLREILKRVLGR